MGAIRFFNCGDLTFEEPDFVRFPCIELAFEALKRLGTAGAALNLANDYSVFRFLNGEINFTDIPRINASAIEDHHWIEHPSLDDLKALNGWVKDHVNLF